MPVTLITGANRGIGFATARQLLDRGHTVYIGARNAKKGGEAAREIGARFVQLDVTDDASVDSALACIDKAEGRLDVLVNNAGIQEVGSDGPTALRAFDTNAVGVLRVIEASLPLLRKSRNAHVITISSSAGSFWAVTNPDRPESQLTNALYAASKAAATMLTLQYSKAHPDIRFNALEPGYTATDMTAAFEGGRSVEATARIVAEFASSTGHGVSGRLHDEHGELAW